MKLFLKLITLFVIFISVSFCAPKKEIQSVFPQEIKTVYYQKWTIGKEKSQQGTHFYIEFKKPLSKNLKLKKIYFQNQETKIVRITATIFKASFSPKPPTKDFIMDKNVLKEYGNEAPVITKPKFVLKQDEAMLEYKSNNHIKYFKLTHVNERKMILYP